MLMDHHDYNKAARNGSIKDGKNNYSMMFVDKHIFVCSYCNCRLSKAKDND